MQAEDEQLVLGNTIPSESTEWNIIINLEIILAKWIHSKNQCCVGFFLFVCLALKNLVQ